GGRGGGWGGRGRRRGGWRGGRCGRRRGGWRRGWRRRRGWRGRRVRIGGVDRQAILCRRDQRSLGGGKAADRNGLRGNVFRYEEADAGSRAPGHGPGGGINAEEVPDARADVHGSVVDDGSAVERPVAAKAPD